MDDLRSMLQGIYDAHGELTPQLVVGVARDPGHPLHHRFNWDDVSAAEAHRLSQARGIIRRVRIVYTEPTATDEGRSVRAFHSVAGPDGRPSYQPAEEVVSSPVARALLLQQMRRDWQAMKRRYGHFEEFAEMVAADLTADQQAS